VADPQLVAVGRDLLAHSAGCQLAGNPLLATGLRRLGENEDLAQKMKG